MDSPVLEDKEVQGHLISYLSYLEAKVPLWEKQVLPGTGADIKVPGLVERKDGKGEFSVASMGILSFKNEAERAKQAALQEEYKKHQGLPHLLPGVLYIHLLIISHDC